MDLRLMFLVVALANAGFGLQMDKNDFAPDDVDEASIAEFRKATTKGGPKKNIRTGQTITLDKVKSQFAAIEAKAKQFVTTNGPTIAYTLLKVGSQIASLSSKEASDNLMKVSSVTQSLEKNWAGLTSNDAASIAKSVVDIVTAASTFIPPPYGTVVSTLMGLVSNLMGQGGGARPKGMGEIMKEVMTKELQNQYVQELKGKVQGAVDALEANQVFLNGYTGGNVTDRDYQFMISQFDVVKRIELRGELMALAEKLAKSKKQSDAADAIKLIDRYILLSSMVEILMHGMKSILEEDPQTKLSAQNLGNAIDAIKVQSRRYLEFVRNPKQENGVFLATYNPKNNPTIEAYLDSLQITPTAAPLEGGCYQLSGKGHKGKAHDAKLQSSVLDGPVKYASDFQFTRVGKYYIVKSGGVLVCGSLKSQYLVVDNKDNCTTSEDRAHYRVYSFADGGYLILNDKWPSSPLRMQKKSQLVSTSNKSELNISAASKEWDEQNPEYVWMLNKGTCS